ncbi:MAG: glycosyltransferase family 4 protein [Anaerolineae bacterium]|nr:glycosyltransferase family 4 protein [Anaerolineae bacterium]
MRIGQITGEYPPMQGGVGAYTKELAKALIDLGHELFVFTDYRAAANHVIPEIHVTADAHSWGWGTLSRVRHWANAQRLDVVNIQYQAAAFNMAAFVHLLPMRVGNARVVTTFHDLLVPYLFPKAGPLRYQAVLTLARSSDGVIVTNRGDYDRLVPVKSDARLQHIPIGSNIAPQLPPDYNRSVWRAALGIQPSDIVIGYFGFLNASKGVETLLQALRLTLDKGLPVKLLMIGGRTGTSDPANIVYAREVDQMVEDLDLLDHIRWTGFVDDQAVSGHLTAADMVALPFRDGVSFRRGSLMAALVHGCAIITTHPQIDEPDLIEQNTMRLIPPDSSTALCIAIEDLADNADLRKAMGRRACELSREFAWDRIAARTATYFETLLEDA